jgi:5-methylcytosine-specific restriction endonuclease McrA
MRDDTLLEARSFHTRLVDLLRVEFSSLGAFLEALAEFDRLGLFRPLGYADLFSYLHRGLKLSRAAAHHRRAAAWLVERFPEVLAPIREGKLCFTTAAVLASVVTKENLAAVLPRFYGLSKQEALELAAELKPRPVVPTRTVVTRAEPTRSVVTVEDVKTTGPEIRPGEQDMPRRDGERTLVEPMTATASRMHLTVSREFLALLKRAKAGESHRAPGATDEQVLTTALELLIEKQGKRKASVPARVKRGVVKRDEGKCQWKLADGGICGATVRLEIDHLVPRGRGGPSTVDNCRVLCGPHNLEAARLAYGDEVMDRYARNPVVGEPCAAYFAAGAAVILALPQQASTLRPASARPASSPGANLATAKRGACAGSCRKLGSTATQRPPAATSVHSCQTKRAPSQATPTTSRPSSPSPPALRR